MRLVILGAGYVGLVTGACCAEMGHQVACLDIDEAKIALLEEGRIPFFEPHLEELVRRNRARLQFAAPAAGASLLSQAEVCFIAVPTPSLPDGSCDLSAVMACASSIAEQLADSLADSPAHSLAHPLTIVIKSTVPVGTHRRVEEAIESVLRRRGAPLTFRLVSNPEFLKEGSAVDDCMRPDRILLGSHSPEAIQTMRQLYAPFTVQHDRILVMDPLSAELTKYAANAMLASRISFMNEIAGLCEALGADIHAIRVGIGSDRRIGYSFLYAGVGYGGSCFPKDIAALKAMARAHGYPLPLIEAVDEVNERQKGVLGEKMARYFAGSCRGKTIALWGLSFKPDTDDVREAPALRLARALLEQGAHLRLYDPEAMRTARLQLGDLPHLYWASDACDAARGADAIALLTEWKEFRSIDLALVQQAMRGRGFFDGRNQYRAAEMRAQGWDYFGIGTG